MRLSVHMFIVSSMCTLCQQGYYATKQTDWKWIESKRLFETAIIRQNLHKSGEKSS